MSARQRVEAALTDAGSERPMRGSDWRCPAHDDRTPSLSVGVGADGRVLLRCQAGCELSDVLDALGLSKRDLFDEQRKNGNRAEIVATYPYVDEAGALLFEVVRFHPKDFRQRRPDPGAPGGWTWKLADVRRVLYRLPQVLEAVATGRTLWITEGERDAEALETVNECSTTNPGGAGKWRSEYNAFLKGAHVKILADRDAPGRKHARHVAQSLAGHAASVELLEPTRGKDAAEHLGAGGSLDELRALETAESQTTAETSGGAAHEPSPNGQGARRYRARRLADVKPERVHWLWPAWIPSGMHSVLDGPPGAGKSTLALDLAARVTTGRPMPGEELASLPTSDVILCTVEDPLAQVVRPRLDAAGADVSRVHAFEAVRRADDDGCALWAPFSIPGDLGALEELILDTSAALVIVDVLMAFLAASHDSYRDQDVRAALAPLGEMAERTGAAILSLRHPRKSGGTAMAAGSGSIAIGGSARSWLAAAPDPNDETGEQRVLATVRPSLVRAPISRAYRLVPSEDPDYARVEWGGEVDVTADQLYVRAGDDEERTALRDATDWLESVLDQPMPRREVMDLARRDGLSERTLKRAAQQLGVVSSRDDSERGRPTTWSLQGFGPRVSGQTALAHNHQGSDLRKRAESEGYGPTFELGPKSNREGSSGASGEPPENFTAAPDPASNGTPGEQCSQCGKTARRYVPHWRTGELWCPDCCHDLARVEAAEKAEP